MRDAVAVVLKKGDAFLLIERAKKGEAEGYWCPITGAVEDGETQAAAVIREAREEMGITVQPLAKVWQCYTDNKDYTLHWWHARIIDEKIAANPAEVRDYRWVTVDRMIEIKKMFEADRYFFNHIGVTLHDASE